ncbi:MAG: D-2-hydroxyacid dehydrogenase [Chloroflexota bacterium]
MDVALTQGEQPAETPDAVLIWGFGEHLISGVLREHPRVRWVHLRRAGVSDEMLAAMRENPSVVFTNGRGGRGPAVAEYAVVALLALLKGLPELHARQDRREWVRDFRMQEAGGKTVAILGLGDVGRNAARLLKAVGMHVIGIRRQPGAVPDVDETYDSAQLRSLLSRVSALIIAAPYTPDTEGLIGANELALMPEGSFLVNVGRGELVDTEALVAALKSGHLAGAALDVFVDEPLPPSSPLWSMPNVIISPHAASHTPESDDRGLEVFLENLRRFRGGEPLLNVVDAGLGY